MKKCGMSEPAMASKMKSEAGGRMAKQERQQKAMGSMPAASKPMASGASKSDTVKGKMPPKIKYSS